LKQTTKITSENNLEEWEEEYWQKRYSEWSKDTWGIQFYNSDKPTERVIFVKWVKKMGKCFKERGDVKAMTLAYNILKNYELYPVNKDKLIPTLQAFNLP